MCPPSYLGKTMDLMNGCGLVIAINDRLENVNTTESNVRNKYTMGKDDSRSNDENQKNLGNLFLQSAHFSKDGILMSPSSVMGHLLRHVLVEFRRRNLYNKNTQEMSSSDLDPLVTVLQRSENHLLATRVLLGTWYNCASKSQVSNWLIICIL